MKPPTKPISSPGRNDKFPPPLMRFLRNNAGSRSRGKSRSSTIFLRKKNNTTTIETQEPSSPKVTCMGQVRVTCSSKKPAAKRGNSVATSGGGASTKFPWVPNHLFCGRFTAAKLKPCSSSFNCQCHCQPFWPNWGFFFRRKGSNVTELSTKPEVNFRGRHNYETEEEETEQELKDSVSNSCSMPPRNALLLMRCRSAPYRSSSLASRFWGSPLKGEETGEEHGKTDVENRESNENEGSHLQRESILEQEDGKDLKLELKMRFFKELEDSLRERIMESEKAPELMRRKGGAEEDDPTPRPVVLTRCKSEPARTAGKLVPEANNPWKKRRLGFADTFYPRGL